MQLFGLMDCNNFYVSCERAFNPRLEKKPVLVLSNNDGCVIARSHEVKQLGVAMGTPFFKIKKFCKQEGIIVFSSNYALYADMSSRVMQLLQQSEPFTEIYSIDEIFFSLEGKNELAMRKHFIFLRERIKQSTGIPVSIGVSTTKTLAKVANHLGKQQYEEGVCLLLEKNCIQAALQCLPVGEVWGVGRQWNKKLQSMQINTALQLQQACRLMMRDRFSVVMARLIDELSGIACIDLETVLPEKKSIVCSRSFGRAVASLATLHEAISLYATRACEKLRAQGSTVSCLQVFVQADAFSESPYYKTMSYRLPCATDDTRQIIAIAKQCLGKIYKPNLSYKKVGVMLTQLNERGVVQTDLFAQASGQTSPVMIIMDKINRRFSAGQLYLAAQGCANKQTFRMRAGNRSQHYTTCWSQLPKAD